MQLTGRRIVVTGAGGHYGKAVCGAIADAGAHVIPFDRSTLDVRLPAYVKQQLDGVSPFDGLVHAAGSIEKAAMCHVANYAEQIATLETNLIGTFIVLRTCCEIWTQHSITASAVLLSGGGVGGPARPWMAAYAASKAGVVQLVESIATEYGDRVRVNALAPGSMASKMNADPTQFGDSTDAAVRCAVFLLSEAASAINGRLISAVRDPWETWDGRSFDGDVFRLRRTTG